MKKLALLLAVVMLLTMTACAGALPEKETAGEKPAVEEEQKEEPKEAETVTEEQPTEEETPVEEETKTDVYAELIAQYTQAVTEGWDAGKLMEKDMNYLVALCGSENKGAVGYTVTDLNGDGREELVIGATEQTSDEFYQKMVFALYALDDSGGIVRALDGGERDRYYYAGEDLFANVGSGSASESFDTTLQLQGWELIDKTYTTEPEQYVQLSLTPFAE